jgi:hypothetical protein
MQKFSDTTIINFMQNHKVAVRYDGESKRWVATTKGYEGKGKAIRAAIIDLRRKAYEEDSIVA